MKLFDEHGDINLRYIAFGMMALLLIGGLALYGAFKAWLA